LINQHIFKVIVGSFPQWFVHFHLLEALPFFREIAKDKATTMGHIKREHLSQWDVAIPPDVVLEVADRLVGRLYDLILANECESQSLTTLRDFLLPKLLSGEIRVREVEKLVERAGA